MPIATDLGFFDVLQYEMNGDRDGAVARFTFTFTAGDPFPATRLGFVQMVRSRKRGAIREVYRRDPFIQPGIVKGMTGAGFRIDQESSVNPLFAVRDPGDFNATNPNPSFGTIGTPDGSGQIVAGMYDRPQIPGEADCSQAFETTCLAFQMDGDQDFIYCGSIAWGWQTDSPRPFDIVPLSRNWVSNGFINAADLWNGLGGVRQLPTRRKGAQPPGPPWQ